MLTIQKLAIYRIFEGNIDWFARTASMTEKEIVSDSDWELIGSIEQDFILIRNKVVSERYAEIFDRNLAKNCDNAETIQEIINMFG